MQEELLHKKIEEVMRSADNITRATPPPFLFTRIDARMKNEKNVWWKIASFVSKPIVAFTCICFVLIINAIVIFYLHTSSGLLSPQSNELATADEYSQVSTNLYDFENVKP